VVQRAPTTQRVRDALTHQLRTGHHHHRGRGSMTEPSTKREDAQRLGSDRTSRTPITRITADLAWSYGADPGFGSEDPIAGAATELSVSLMCHRRCRRGCGCWIRVAPTRATPTMPAPRRRLSWLCRSGCRRCQRSECRTCGLLAWHLPGVDVGLCAALGGLPHPREQEISDCRSDAEYPQTSTRSADQLDLPGVRAMPGSDQYDSQRRSADRPRPA
jgi:hypothetical protein